MHGIILQISVSSGGLPKRAILRASVNELGIEGDGHAHPRYHGGPKQALLIVTVEGIDQLNESGFDLSPGALGENLTTRGLDRRTFRAGQRYRSGGVLLELTKIRQPCEALNAYGAGIQKALYDARVKQGDATSPLWGLSGFYASVLEPGEILPEDIIALVD